MHADEAGFKFSAFEKEPGSHPFQGVKMDIAERCRESDNEKNIMQ